MGMLPAQLGYVSFGGCGSLTGIDEEALDHGQLPQFLPRARWPDDHVARSLGRHTAPLGTGIDWTARSEVEGLRGRVTVLYSALAPMPSFASGHYDGTPWLAHVAFMHDILHRSISDKLPLSRLEMFALLRTVSYGMFESMAWLYPWHLPGPDGDGKLTEEWRCEFSMRIKVGEFHEPGSDKQYYLYRMYGRRWVVAPVLCGEEQWIMTIFDRCQRHLYVFDCGDGPGRGGRIEACVHLWARFWNWLHLPWDFQYFVPRVTQQTDAKDSGLISIVWLMSVLRDQVGESMSADDGTAQRTDVAMADANADVELEPSDLCPGDWLPGGCKLAYGGLLAVRRIVMAMICNELGLKHHEVLTKVFRNCKGRLPAVVPSALALLQATSAQLAAHDSTLAADVFWTAQGGPQFALAQQAAASPYEHDAPRRHRPCPQQGRFRVETNPTALSRRPAQAVRWPAGAAFPAEAPVKRRADCLEARPWLDAASPLQFDEAAQHIELGNGHVGPRCQFQKRFGGRGA